MQVCLEGSALSKAISKNVRKLVAKFLDLSLYWTRVDCFHKIGGAVLSSVIVKPKALNHCMPKMLAPWGVDYKQAKVAYLVAQFDFHVSPSFGGALVEP